MTAFSAAFTVARIFLLIYLIFPLFFFLKDKLALAHFPKKEDAYFCLFVCHAGTHVMRE